MNKEIEKIKVKIEKNELYIKDYKGQNLLEILQENHVFVPNICHGNGICGKCKVKLLSGNLPITEADRRTLSKEELELGIRLACKADVEEVCKAIEENELSVEIIGQAEDNIVIEGIPLKQGETESHKGNESTIEKNEIARSNDTTATNYFIAVDIGTTTIAMALVNADTGKVLATYTSLNHQRKFGADVISRIVAANNGKAEELKNLIEEDLWKGIRKLAKIENEAGISVNDKREDGNKQKKINLTQVIIVGNTTMIHLLMGYSCQSLGKYPFISEHLEQIECMLKECITLDFDNSTLRDYITLNLDNDTRKDGIALVSNSTYDMLKNISTIILPGISAFVGGDIVADILTCPKFETEEISLLIDLGTNGEMVLGNKDRLLTASTAAGPAFEGGNIICGTAGIPGSVCQVKIQNQRAVIKTIKNIMPPVGICGTGLVSAIAQLKQSKLMNEQGELRYPYNEKGYSLWTLESGEKIALYQQDIREFQMAKSAIRAGIEVLMQEYGCTVEEISHVYLAGGFGVNLLEEDVICTGILPEEFRGKIEAIGNGALQGAIQVAERQNNKKTIDQKIKGIMERTQNVSLAESKNFQENYLKYLDF